MKNIYRFAKTYQYIYEVEAKNEKEAKEKVKQLYIGDYKTIQSDEYKLVDKKEKQKKVKNEKA